MDKPEYPADDNLNAAKLLWVTLKQAKKGFATLPFHKNKHSIIYAEKPNHYFLLLPETYSYNQVNVILAMVLEEMMMATQREIMKRASLI